MRRGGLNLDYFVYFIKPVGLDGPIKIGCSCMPPDRLMGLATWSPFPLELIGYVPGSFKAEKRLHALFQECHSHHEWFRWTPDLHAAIQRIIKTGSIEEASSASSLALTAEETAA